MSIRCAMGGPPRAPRCGGFTLVEMVVVVAIVGVLATAARPVVQLVQRRAQEAQLRLALRQLRDAIDAYKHAADEALIDVPADASGYPPSLEVLVQGVALKQKEKGAAHAGARLYLLRRLPRDPFAEADMPAARTWGLRSYDSPPDAPRPGRDVFDVHSLSERRALDGSFYRDW